MNKEKFKNFINYNEYVCETATLNLLTKEERELLSSKFEKSDKLMHRKNLSIFLLLSAIYLFAIYSFDNSYLNYFCSSITVLCVVFVNFIHVSNWKEDHNILNKYTKTEKTKIVFEDIYMSILILPAILNFYFC